MPRHLTQTLQYMFEQSVRQPTHNSYTSAFNHYKSFCTEFGLTLFPISEEKYMYYVAYAIHKIKAASVKTYMNGINYNARISGYPVDLDTMPHLKQVKRALTVVFDAKQRKERNPYYWEDFEEDVKGADLTNYNTLVCYTALAGALLTMMRPAEYCAKNLKVNFQSDTIESARTLFIKNLQIVRDEKREVHHCVLTCRMVKTDAGLVDVDIVWPKGKWPLSPADWLMKMLVLRHKLAKENRHLLIEPTAFLFCFDTGKVLTLFEMRKFFVSLIESRGWEVDKYPLYAIKDGGVNSLRQHGATHDLVKQLGRWKSDAYLAYMKLTHKDVANQLHLYTKQPIINPNLVYVFDRSVGYVLKQ